LSWPASGVGFALYSATNLITPVVWNLVTNPAALVNNQWQILLPLDDSAARFYRLQAR
jgi:formylmethanofuran dehydrogenase subunit A